MSRAATGHAVNPSYNVWSKFFEKHMYIGQQRGGSGGGSTNSNNNRINDTTSSSNQRLHYGTTRLSVSTKGGNRSPRRVRSHRDMTSEGIAAHNGARVTAADSAAMRASSISSESEYDEMITRLRKMVLMEGVPSDDFQLPNSRTPARPLIWKLLLGVRSTDAAMYLTLLARGPSVMHDKICNDTFRTLATDQLFKERVDEAALIRMLNAFVWRYSDSNASSVVHDKAQLRAPVAQFTFSYVQGMNVLAAPFLYVMPSELEAFHCFCQFIECFCPTYVQPTLSGVHRGLQLLERCLKIADPALSNHLLSLKLNAELYAFPSVLTMSACTPPLRQVLQVWDYLLAFGVHMSIPCIVAQLLLIRDELMATHHPMKILRQFPDLDARSVVGIATTLVRDMDDNLYDDLVRHMIEL